MVYYYFLCTFFTILFIYYLINCFTDAYIGFTDDGRKFAVSKIVDEEGGFESWIGALHRDNLFRHIVYVILLGAFSYFLIFKSTVTTTSNGTTKIEVTNEQNKSK